MRPRQKRFAFIAVGVAGVAVAVGLVLYALRGNVNLYFTPTQVFNNEVPSGRSFRTVSYTHLTLPTILRV